MKFYQETTEWPDAMPNGIYLLNDSKDKMFAYVRPGATVAKEFKNPIRIDTRGRKFKAVPNTFGWVERKEEPEGERWEVKGSKGDTYIVERIAGVMSCTCSGFRFRGDCKHVKDVK